MSLSEFFNNHFPNIALHSALKDGKMHWEDSMLGKHGKDILSIFGLEKANIDHVSSNGDNFLHSAVRSGDISSVKIAMAIVPIDIATRGNNDSDSPSKLAKNLGHTEISDMIDHHYNNKEHHSVIKQADDLGQ